MKHEIQKVTPLDDSGYIEFKNGSRIKLPPANHQGEFRSSSYSYIFGIPNYSNQIFDKKVMEKMTKITRLERFYLFFIREQSTVNYNEGIETTYKTLRGKLFIINQQFI